MSDKPKCTCIAKVTYGGAVVREEDTPWIIAEVVHCPLHKAAGDMLAALEGIADDAQEMLNDICADVQEGATISGDAFARYVQKWQAVLDAITKAQDCTHK